MSTNAVKPLNATGSIKARIEELNIDFSSSGVSFASQPLPKIQGYSLGEEGFQSVMIGAYGVTGPGNYSVDLDWLSSVTISFNFAGLPFSDLSRSGTIFFEAYEQGKKAKGTFDVMLFSSGHRVQGTFDVVSD
ncbi:hypothetical protein [Pseudomonas fluorescens]|jgi:hypothetical protein|uniref:hypothetical protein n=1 Tax=Pseudomonas fluorescens TaxID=294 RepID=UPI000CA18880|nr:hypothetical protein [Pseudomonas fluorescens]AUM71279.1 hypothetical protein C0J56_22155 [Pseudomonas fluorescens]